ncbi:hypothetical protein JQ609_26475 [Bradyrhizobium sp. AUGA SZCCT0169]|uniref:hypothetical protein n=1 Tax=Bradyrhizobium sp. AUGA SZCCT0169 TaxID=2807663 RepID=UPI001BAD1FEE|nr:hypothetical protein [Bradyrhizobium sp. AUGA SZCCT0169]MBR1250453.1 hypothetical protein [Bradyrhizobium sp. AUGA SZCCT0169]
MKPFEVRGISSKRSTVPSGAVLDSTLKPSGFRSRFDLSDLHASRDPRAPAGGLDVPVEPMTRVELKVSGAVPQSNFTNIRVNGNLMIGTMLDEAGQKLTGYVRASLPKRVDVELEFADGTRSVFNVEHE